MLENSVACLSCGFDNPVYDKQQCPECLRFNCRIHSKYGNAAKGTLKIRYKCANKDCSKNIFSISVCKNLLTYKNKYNALLSTCEDLLDSLQQELPHKIMDLINVVRVCKTGVFTKEIPVDEQNDPIYDDFE
jgi:hypothetical protein